jgi:glutathione S-transferase
MPTGLVERQHALRRIGLALAACEKSVQIIYERELRPAEKQHEPWVTRVTGQLLAAYRMLESELERRPLAASSATIDQAGISVAVAWHFTRQTIPDVVPAAGHPALCELSAQAEALHEFLAAPHGSGTYHDANRSESR